MLIYVIEAIMNYMWLDKLLQGDIHGFLSGKHPKHNALHIWLRKSYVVRSEKSAHPTKNQVSVKGSSLYFKDMTFYFQEWSIFLVPKKMGSLLIRFWETTHPPPPSQHFALSLRGEGVRQFSRNVYWSNVIHKMFSKTIINFLAICQDSCWAPNFKVRVLGL